MTTSPSSGFLKSMFLATYAKNSDQYKTTLAEKWTKKEGKTYHWIDQVIINIWFSDELWGEHFCQLLPYCDQFFDVKLRCRMDNCRKCLVHIFWGTREKEHKVKNKVSKETSDTVTESIDLPELCDLCESSIDLIAHRWDHIVNWNHAFLIDKSFSPDLRIDFIASLQMLANVVLLLCNRSQFLTPVDVNATLRLSQHRTTINIDNYMRPA